MVKITESIEIKAPVDKVFAYVVNGENAPEWHLTVKEAKRIAGKVGKTSVMRYLVAVGRRRYEFETRVAEFEENKRYVDEMTKGPFKKYIHVGTFEKTDDGCRYIFDVDYELRWSFIGKIVARMVKSKVRKDVVKSLEKLKEILESRKV